MPLGCTDRQRIPGSYQLAKVNDLLWIIYFSISSKSTPMWVRWNAQHRIDKKVTEKIRHVLAINQSPTLIAIKKTIKRTQQMAVECRKREIALTYDLAIAEMAMEIQIKEPPTFDNIFVTLGSFHIEMASFSVLGKYISESDGPHLLTQSGIIENGSPTFFLLGKSYKRSKRIHQLLALVMEIQILIPSSYLCKKMILRNKKWESWQNGTILDRNVNMLHLYHKFSRSIRTGDLDLYIYCLHRMTALFFTFNHQNYSCSCTVCHDKLLKLKNSHPDIYEEFMNGSFSLKQTSKPFSRVPIDPALEQTIKSDAACQRSGIYC